MQRSFMACFVWGLILPAWTAWADDAPAKPQKAAATDQVEPSRAELEKQFAETLSEATMVGSYTATGQPADAPPKQDKYTLGQVKKLKEDYWLFETRIQYGDHDVKVPLTVEVKWAGDTPVITLTDVQVPGLGTFTARVVVYKDQYAGTWSGGDHGGHLFGKIVKEKAKK